MLGRFNQLHICMYNTEKKPENEVARTMELENHIYVINDGIINVFNEVNTLCDCDIHYDSFDV